jgi:tetratricopeptide (TPR) repeat protein
VGVAWQAVAARRAEARATQRFHDVRAIANRLLFDFDNSIMHVPGTLKARQLLVNTALEYLDKLARDASGDDGDDVNLQNELAMAYIGVGRIQFEQSLPHIGDRAGAIASFKKALAIARHAEARRPGDPRLRLTLALALARYGSTAYHDEPGPSIAACEEALAILEPLAQSPDAHRAMEIDLGAVMFSLGWALSDTGQIQQGLAMRQRALDHFLNLRAKRPTDIDVALWLAATHTMVGKSLHLAGRLDEAEQQLGAGRALQVELATTSLPNSVLTRRNIAMTDTLIAEICAQRGDLGRAADLYDSAADAMEALVRADPENMQARADFGMNLHRAIELRAAGGDVDGALRAFESRFLPIVQARYAAGHAMLLRYQLEHASLLRLAKRFDRAAALLDACERDARGASSFMLANVIRAQVELYRAWDKRDLATAAEAKLVQTKPVTTQPTH